MLPELIDKRPQIECLAGEINEFMHDYDIYGYNDAVDDPEAEVDKIIDCIFNDDVLHIHKALKSVHEDLENEIDYESTVTKIKADSLRFRLSDVLGYKPADDIMERYR